jgi:hypothetical protein
MPVGAVFVGPGTEWANPYAVGAPVTKGSDLTFTPASAVVQFRAMIASDPNNVTKIRRKLRGKSLACHHPLSIPCHVDALLEIANSTGPWPATPPKVLPSAPWVTVDMGS